MIEIKIYSADYLLLLGANSTEIFDYFGVDTLHGLTRAEAEAYNDTEAEAYIRGLTNVSPKDATVHFMFINMKRYKVGDYKSHTAISHEAFHLAKLKQTTEEQIATVMEQIANTAIEICEAAASSFTIVTDEQIRAKYE